MTSDLRLGDAVNLLHGLRPGWVDSVRGGCPFLAPPRRPFITFDMNVPPDEAAEWSGPTLSLHDNVEDLVTEIFDYRVAPFPADPGVFRLPASTLMLADEDRHRTLDSLSELLGLQLTSDQSGGFILLKMRRVVRGFQYEVAQGGIGLAIKIGNYWTPEGRNAMGRLRVASKISEGTVRDAVVTARQAVRYVDYFYDFGTHFVSRAEFGDLILQVLACKPARYRELKERLIREARGTRVSGALVHSLGFYTSSEWVSARGKIVSASGDVTLTQTLHAGKWHDDEFARGDSLLAPFASDSTSLREFCRQSVRVVPITVEFSPQNPFMEVFRACAWQRILKAALLQRFSTGLQLPVTQRRSLACKDHFSDGALFPAIASRTTQVFQDRLNAADFQFINGNIVESFTAFSLAAEFTNSSPILLPGKRVVLCAYQTVARAEDGTIPVLSLEEEAFENYEFITCEMQGALFVTNRAGGRRETILDGLRFATETESGQAGRVRVTVRGDLQTPATETLQRLAGVLESSLDVAESMLLTRTARGSDTFRFARGYLEWLAMILSGDDERQALRVRVLYLARAANCLPPKAMSVPQAISEFHADELSAMFDVAVEVQHLWTHIRMQIRECRLKALQANVPTAADVRGRLLGEFASALQRLGDRVEDVLRAICFRHANVLESDSDRIKDLGEQTQSVHQDILAAVNEIKRNLADSDASSCGQAILEAMSDILSSEPTMRGPERPPEGNEPISEFWRLMFKIRHVLAATTALELLSDLDENQPLDHVEQLLDALDGPVELPSQPEWHGLPGLVTQLLGSSRPPEGTANLEAALRSFVVAADPWLAARLMRAQFKVVHNCRWQQRESTSNRIIDSDISQASNRLQNQQWRLTRLLAQAWNLLEDAVESAGMANVAPLEKLDLAAIARSLLVRQRYLN